MDPIQPVWADAAHGFVRVVFDGIEKLIPADSENRDYAELLADEVDIAPYQPPAPQVPEGVLRHPGLIVLLDTGITEQAIREKIAEIADPVQRELTRLRFEQPEWRRGGEFFAWLSGAFSLTQDAVDALLVAARAA